jgi:UMF1 family MFS transporter
MFGITEGFAAQLSFLLVGIWWFSFASLSLKRLPKSEPAGEMNSKSILTNGYKELRKVWNQLTHHPLLKRYLIAFFFFQYGSANSNAVCHFIW